jgi:hypothetical protein
LPAVLLLVWIELLAGISGGIHVGILVGH